MERKDSDKMTPFDQLVSNQNLQMLKLFIPYTPPETQRFLAVYVKFSELQYTMDFFQNFKRELHAQDFDRKVISPLEMIQEIRPYLPAQASETLDTILNMINMMELFETFRETSDSGSDAGSGFDPVSMMKNMLTPEQQGILDMYSTMFSQEADTESETEAETEPETKGDETYD